MGRDIVSTLGIQSYCFRGFKEHARVIEGLRACEVDRLEICGVHFNPVEDANAEETLKVYGDAGVVISSFGVNRFDADEAAGRKVFEFAKLAGFPTISATLSEGGLPVAEKLCEEYGKKIAIHNHGRRDELGSVKALARLFEKASMNVGLCLDTAWMQDSGEDPLAVAKQFQDRLYGIHVKDFVFDRAGKHQDVVVGTGNLDLDALAAFLVESDFDGYLTLEYEGDVADPVPALKECCATIRKAFANA